MNESRRKAERIFLLACTRNAHVNRRRGGEGLSKGETRRRVRIQQDNLRSSLLHTHIHTLVLCYYLSLRVHDSRDVTKERGYIYIYIEAKREGKAHMANKGVSGSGIAGGLGKGAWDCDKNELIPPELESTIFEEQPTDEFNYEGIATVPIRKNMSHMAFFCNGCRYRLEAYPDWTARRVKEALFAGGITRQNKPHLAHVSETRGIEKWEDIVRTHTSHVRGRESVFSILRSSYLALHAHTLVSGCMRDNSIEILRDPIAHGKVGMSSTHRQREREREKKICVCAKERN